MTSVLVMTLMSVMRFPRLMSSVTIVVPTRRWSGLVRMSHSRM